MKPDAEWERELSLFWKVFITGWICRALSDIQSLLKQGEKNPPSFKEMYGYLKKK